MTDLPADPNAWADEPASVDPSRVHRTTARPSDDAAGDPPLPVRVLDGANGEVEPELDPDHRDGPLPPTNVAYESLSTLAARPSARALIGPFIGVALVALGLGFLLARTAGTSGTPSGRTVVTPPPATTAAVLGATAARTTTTATTIAPTTTARPATTTAAPSTTAAATTVIAVTSTAVAPTTTLATTQTTAAAVADPARTISGVDVVAPVRWAIFSAGKVYLYGRVPDTATQATIVRKVSAVVGEANVFPNYELDPAAPAVAGGPLTVADTVQFDPDDTTVRPEFARILGLGVVLMQQNPAVRITVVGRSDSRGEPGYNLDLSRRRAAAVAAFLTAQGADASRLTIDARGAADPLVPGDDEEALQANRSVEFVILGLLE